MIKGCGLSVLMMVMIILPGLTFTSVSAQQTASIRRDVAQRLKSIKPKDTKEYVYRVKVPVKPLRLPSSLRLDLVYKIGHYQWDLVALRFERSGGSPFVNISQVVFSSAFPFIKEDSKIKDSYSVKVGRLSVQEFDQLLSLAYTLYRSNIERKYIGTSNRNGFSMTSSSGDGTIILQLTKTSPSSSSIISESGTLHAGDFSARVTSDYEYVRVHLFWQVFHEYLKTHSILHDMDKEQAVDLLIARLKEPPMADDYKDYDRQALYVHTLGELGSARAIQTLEHIAQNTGLEENWSGFLKQDVSEAIEKIKAQVKPHP
jgi:hypothetical protein